MRKGKLTEPITTLLAPATCRRIDQLASQRGCSKAAVVRWMVQDALARLGGGADTPVAPSAPAASGDHVGQAYLGRSFIGGAR